jgi:hypothetical protein
MPSAAFRRQETQGNPKTGEDERKLADLRQARRYGERRVERVAESEDE